MAGGERDQLNAAGKEQWIGAEHECAGALLHKGGEDCLNLAAIAGVEHFDPLSDGRCRSAHLGSNGFGQWIVWIEQQPDEIGARQQFTDQAEPFFRQPAAEEIHASRVAAGPVEARYKPRLDWIVFAAEDDGYRRGSCLRRGTPRSEAQALRADHDGEIQRPASPPAVRAPRTTRPPRRRAA